MSSEAQNNVLALLDRMGIPYRITQHKAVYTIDDMENLELEHIEHVVKNLFLRNDKKSRYYLVVIPKDKTANLKELQARILSRRLSFASEEDLMKYLGLPKGAVSPFGTLNDTENMVTVVFDGVLRDGDFIGVHPNENTATVWITVDDLVKVLRGKGQEVLFADV